jgi:DNA-directed RNA polymerase subunit RPC12/RpoP
MPEHALFQSDEATGATCPYCGSGETEFFSLFGSQLLTAQYYCRACHTPFEQVKNDDVLADAARRALAEERRGARREERREERRKE